MIQFVNFHAQWTSANTSLNPPSSLSPSKFTTRVYLAVKNIFLLIPRWLIANLAKRIFYPAVLSSTSSKTYQVAQQRFSSFWQANVNDRSFYQGQADLSTLGTQGNFIDNPYGLWAPYFRDTCKNILATYRPREFRIKTPDDCAITGHYFEHARSQEPNARVLLVFGGNGELYPQGGACAPLLQILHDHPTPYSFLLMYPRGVGTSSGTISSRGLLLDGESLYQYAQHLGYAEDRIDLYGQSMGGAVAAHVKSLHPHTGGTVVLDRTFSKLSTVASDHAKNFPFHPVGLVRGLCHASGWDLDNVSAVKKIRDPVYIYHHEDDWVMRNQGSLYSTFHSQQSSNMHLVKLTSLSHTVLSKAPFPKHIQFLQKFHQDPHLMPLPMCLQEGADLSTQPSDIQKNAQALCEHHLLQNPFAQRA